MPEKYLWFACDAYEDKETKPQEPDLKSLIMQKWAELSDVDDKSLKAQIIKDSFPNIPTNTLSKIIKWKSLCFWLKGEKERNQIRESRRVLGDGQKQKIQNEKLLKGCLICGYKKCAAALDFHHIDPSTKTNGVARIYHADEAIKEASKCVVLCKICHAEFHAGIINLPNHE